MCFGCPPPRKGMGSEFFSLLKSVFFWEIFNPTSVMHISGEFSSSPSFTAATQGPAFGPGEGMLSGLEAPAFQTPSFGPCGFRPGLFPKSPSVAMALPLPCLRHNPGSAGIASFSLPGSQDHLGSVRRPFLWQVLPWCPVSVTGQLLHGLSSQRALESCPEAHAPPGPGHLLTSS